MRQKVPRYGPTYSKPSWAATTGLTQPNGQRPGSYAACEHVQYRLIWIYLAASPQSCSNNSALLA
jgi:hypothetical protein